LDLDVAQKVTGSVRMIIENQDVFYTLEAESDGIGGAVNDCVNF
jgi:hypothetical protein